MLDSGKKRNYSETKVASIIGQGTTVTGEVKSKGTVRVEGVVSGRLHSEDTIVVQETGRVKGDLVAGQVVISGEVEGNVYAYDRLEITAKGKLLGDITAPRVSIAEGVLFEGQCTMKPPGQLKPPNAVAGRRPSRLASDHAGSESATAGRQESARLTPYPRHVFGAQAARSGRYERRSRQFHRGHEPPRPRLRGHRRHHAAY